MKPKLLEASEVITKLITEEWIETTDTPVVIGTIETIEFLLASVGLPPLTDKELKELKGLIALGKIEANYPPEEICTIFEIFLDIIWLRIDKDNCFIPPTDLIYGLANVLGCEAGILPEEGANDFQFYLSVGANTGMTFKRENKKQNTSNKKKICRNC